jgi:hypothetical protein
MIRKCGGYNDVKSDRWLVSVPEAWLRVFVNVMASAAIASSTGVVGMA